MAREFDPITHDQVGRRWTGRVTVNGLRRLRCNLLNHDWIPVVDRTGTVCRRCGEVWKIPSSVLAIKPTNDNTRKPGDVTYE